MAIAHRVFSAAVRGLAQTEIHTADDRMAADDALTQTVELFVTALGSGSWPRPRLTRPR